MKNLKEMTDAELAQAQKEFNRMNNESRDGFDTHFDIEWNRRAELKVQAAKDEFTRKVTIARRQEWRDLVSAGKIKDAQSAYNAEQKLGWTLDNLKEAIAKHNL